MKCPDVCWARWFDSPEHSGPECAIGSRAHSSLLATDQEKLPLGRVEC